MSIILLLLVYCTYLVFFTLLIVNMYISNAGPHQPMAASFFNLQDQIKYVCMYVCMYVTHSFCQNWPARPVTLQRKCKNLKEHWHDNPSHSSGEVYISSWKIVNLKAL